MRLATRLVQWTLIFSMVALAAGCGDSLVSPPPTGGSGGGGTGGGTGTAPQFGPEIMVVHADGTVGWTQPPMDWSVPKSDALPDDDDVAKRHTVSAKIDGLLGGKMQCGRFFLSVPPLAFIGSGTITMTTVDSTVMICDVEISPASLNGFRQPIHLGMNTTGLAVGCDTLTMYWYDPSSKHWVDMGADKSLDDVAELLGIQLPANVSGIVTSVRHFSRYGGGKAGW